ncbi:MAG: DNA-binding domain-containing protein [Burkholderiales bacterium]
MRTPSLPELQNAFARGVFENDTGVRDWIVAPAARFDIYRNSVLANLRNALRSVFPVVLRLTGESFFDQAATHFARQIPSHSGDLHPYGDAFSNFLFDYAPARALAYLPDVARLEWHWHTAFHAADAHPFNIQLLGQVAPADYPRLCFEFQPAFHLLHSDYPVLQIWEVNRRSDAPAEVITLAEGADSLIVYRRVFDVEIAKLSTAEFTLAKALHARETFSAAIEQTLGIAEDFDPSPVLLHWAAAGIITGFRVT